MSELIEIGKIKVPMTRAKDGSMWMHQELGTAEYNGIKYRMIQPINGGFLFYK